MYSVSNAYLAAIKQPIQVHKVRGTIGSVAFTDENILEGSFSISNQSTDTSDIVLGSCYIGQLSATFTGLNISRTEWMNKVITPYFQLWFDSVNYEEVPLGVFTIKEVNHTAEGVEVVAYDNMYKFDKKFKKSGLNMVAKPYNFLIVFCQKCGIELGMNSTQVEALPNGNADLYLCGVRKSTTTYANDIETYRDALFWLAQCLGSFATMRRDGKLVLRAYKDTVDDSISDTYRLSGAKFADYITSYTGIYTESLYDGETTYYGYDLATLQQMRDTAMQELEQIITDLADLEEEYAQGQITEEEYKAEKKRLTSEKKAKEKYISWLDKMIAQAQSEGDGAYMDLGANPFFQRRDANIPSIADATLATTLRSHILSALGKIEYTPFSCSSVFGVHYDLGDVIEFNGGHADDDHGCIMSYEWTLHGQYNMEGYGIDPDKQNVKDVKNKQSDRAQKNALKSTKNTTGTDTPVSSNNGDMHIDISENSEIQSIYTGGGMTLDSSSGDANSGYNATAHCRDDTQSESIHFRFDNLEVGGTYTMSAYVQIEGDLVNWNSHNFCISCATGDGVTEGAVPNRPDGQVTVLDNGFGITLFYDNQKHYYEGTFTAIASTYYVVVDIAYLKNTWAYPPRTYPTHVTECKISEGEAPSDGDPKAVKVYVNGEWKTLKYVNKIKQVQTNTGGTKIATAKNSEGADTDIYAPTVAPNPSGAGTAKLEKLQIGTDIYNVGGAEDVGLSVGSNGEIESTYEDGGTEHTEDILRDDTGNQIATVLDSIADTLNLLNQPEVYAPIVYSTEEREVGVWTDGKPLYQKTVFFGSVSNNSTVSLDIANVENIFFVPDGSWINNSVRPLPYVIGSNTTNNIGGFFSISALDTLFEFRIGTNASGDSNNGCITVRYTKTTDVAGSGHYAALGVPAVHYSESEKVIGTWIDGKTLYQRTLKLTGTYSGMDAVIADLTSWNMETIIDIEGNSGTVDTEWNPITFSHPSASGWAKTVYVSGNKLYVCTGTYITYINPVFTLKYTKSTD